VKNPSRFVDEGKIYKINGKDIKVDANRPVEQVSWEDVQRFIQKLNDSQDKYTYSLPSEAQWEFAARAGNESKFSFGEDESLISEYGWYSGNSGNKTHPVASKKTNAFGLHDVHGNVWEWVQDWYGNSLPGGVDPRGPSTGSYRVIRGGSWYKLCGGTCGRLIVTTTALAAGASLWASAFRGHYADHFCPFTLFGLRALGWRQPKPKGRANFF
jgi:formylglycine-generating enzyme required for sulfatase activity